MNISYKIVEDQLVRLNNDRPEKAVNLDAKNRSTVEKYLAALDSNPYVEPDVLICNELDRLLVRGE